MSLISNSTGKDPKKDKNSAASLDRAREREGGKQPGSDRPNDVFVHFGQPLRDLGAVGRLLRHPVVETLCGKERVGSSETTSDVQACRSFNSHRVDCTGVELEFILPLTIFSLLGDSGGLGSASFFFLVATPVTLRFFKVSVPQIMTARFFVNLESPWVRCSWCHFSSSTQMPPPRCTCGEEYTTF
ncbi:hypothetical protein EYF80_014410 [Liparis tanakae]|uniref:Uncharacterized protein n=1 Tax=Liparis tanakae TaxID=230148 RepID=A0A4Z2IEB6_9TELE|nr:hypothetical protein EYF80_014410 [Liparis tanakae]